MNFLLIAVLTSSTGSFLNGDARGYQTSNMHTFATLERCKTAGAQLLETFEAGKAKDAKADRGQIRCVNLETKEVTIISQKN